MIACVDPIPFDQLVALWAEELEPADAERIEAHLFGCDGCALASDRLGALVAGLRAAVPPVISHAHRDRLVASGTRIRTTTVTAGVTARAVFAPDVDLLVHVLRADLSHADRVDVELVDDQDHARVELVAVPFDPEAGEVLIACQRHYRSHFEKDPVFVVHATERGVRREIGRYHVDHVW